MNLFVYILLSPAVGTRLNCSFQETERGSILTPPPFLLFSPQDLKNEHCIVLVSCSDRVVGSFNQAQASCMPCDYIQDFSIKKEKEVREKNSRGILILSRSNVLD